MTEHGMSEILRLPLDALILDLKNMMPDSPVIPILEVRRALGACRVSLQKNMRSREHCPQVVGNETQRVSYAFFSHAPEHAHR